MRVAQKLNRRQRQREDGQEANARNNPGASLRRGQTLRLFVDGTVVHRTWMRGTSALE
jgi:hypothetical protein